MDHLKEVELGMYKGHKLRWVKLAEEEKKCLLLCSWIIEYLPFHEEYTAISWERSSLRRWLNDFFLKQVFFPCVQTGIPDHQTNYKNCEVCTDKVFLLSAEEAERYLLNTETCLSGPAPYLVPQHIGQYIGRRSRDVWWLRSMTCSREESAEAANIIDIAGCPSQFILNDGGRNLNVNCEAGVRPAIWVSKELLQVIEDPGHSAFTNYVGTYGCE